MYLRTLGALDLQDADYARPKALLLLSYLALEGGRDRRHLATLFFGQTQDALGSLRITLSRLRRALPGVIEEQNEVLGVHLECDARSMLMKLDQDDEQGLTLYQGAFLTGVQLPELGVELEEWVYATREYLAGRVRGLLLSMAVRAAALEDFRPASRLAERAAWLKGAADPTPEQFLLLDLLLSAGESPLVDRLTAVLGINDLVAIGAAHATIASGLRIPGDISIAGFDDISMAAVFYPPLTSISHQYEELAVLTVQAAIAAIHGEHPHHVLPPLLVVRGSTAAPNLHL